MQVVAIGDSEAPFRSRAPVDSTRCASVANRDVYFETLGRRVITDIHKGDDLLPGGNVVGPAIIEESTTTIVVYPGDRVEVDESGNYAIHVRYGEV